MTSKTLFFSKITKEINITGDMLDAFSDLFRLQQYQEKEHFILVEEEKNAVGFLIDGFMRTYIIDSEGNEANLRFILPYDFVKGSYAIGVSSPVSIQCIEKCSLYVSDWEDVMAFARANTEFSQFFNLLLSRGYSKTMELLSNLIRLNAKGRYLLFLKKFPGLIDRIPHYLIANHLGITSVQLSRIRKNL